MGRKGGLAVDLIDLPPRPYLGACSHLLWRPLRHIALSDLGSSTHNSDPSDQRQPSLRVPDPNTLEWPLTTEQMPLRGVDRPVSECPNTHSTVGRCVRSSLLARQAVVKTSRCSLAQGRNISSGPLKRSLARCQQMVMAHVPPFGRIVSGQVTSPNAHTNTPPLPSPASRVPLPLLQ